MNGRGRVLAAGLLLLAAIGVVGDLRGDGCNNRCRERRWFFQCGSEDLCYTAWEPMCQFCVAKCACRPTTGEPDSGTCTVQSSNVIVYYVACVDDKLCECGGRDVVEAGTQGTSTSSVTVSLTLCE